MRIVLILLATILSAHSAQAQDEKTLIWAGLQGTPPKYIDSGDNVGLGTMEVASKEVRAGLEDAGFKLIREYITSDRLAYYYKNKTPVCFYPVIWTLGEEKFEGVPERILSIPLTFAREDTRTIIFRKGEAARFSKHMDSKGQVNLDSLIKDQGLRAGFPNRRRLPEAFMQVFVDHGKGQIVVKPEFAKYITFLVASQNRQFINMLANDRFDYTLGEFIEVADYATVKGGREAFQELVYGLQTLTSLEDPNLAQYSVGCSVSPTTIAAMPYINERNMETRGPGWEASNRQYQRLFDASLSEESDVGSLYRRFPRELNDPEKADRWFAKQMQKIPGLKKYPERVVADPLPPLPDRPRRNPQWLELRPDASTQIILNETDLAQFELGIRPQLDRPLYLAKDDRKFLEQNPKKKPLADQFSALPWSEWQGDSTRQRLIVFATGLTVAEARHILPLLNRPELREFALLEGASDVAKLLLSSLPHQLENINFSKTSLSQVHLGPQLAKIPGLKRMDLLDTVLAEGDFDAILRALPDTLSELSLRSDNVRWTPELAKLFGKKKFSKLQRLALPNNGLDDRHCAALNGIGPELRELNLNGNLFTSICLAKHLKQPMLALTELYLSGTWFAKQSPLKIPKTVRTLSLSNTQLSSETLQYLELPPKLTELNLSDNKIDAKGFAKIAVHLAPQIEVLNLGSNPIRSGVFFALATNHVESIRELNLSGALLDDDGFREWESNTTLKQVKSLLLDGTSLNNRTARFIGKKFGFGLTRLSVSRTMVADDALNELLVASPNLRRLSVAGLISLKAAALARALPKGLETLDLSLNSISDRDFALIAKHLPPSLRVLSLDRVVRSAAGIRALAEHMPDLVYLDFDNTLVPQESARFLAKGLSPFLQHLGLGRIDFDKEGALTLANHLPQRLIVLSSSRWTMDPAHWEMIFNKLPNSLSIFNIPALVSPPDSKGIDALSRHWPSGLRFFVLRGAILNEEALRQLYATAPLDTTFSLDHGSLEAWQIIAERIKAGQGFTWTLTTAPTENQLKAVAAMRPPGFTFRKCQIPLGLAHKLGPPFFAGMRALLILGCEIATTELADILRSLPENMALLSLRSVGLKLEDVDGIIAVLPKGLRQLEIAGNDFGPAGVAKFRAYAERVLKTTGLPLILKADSADRNGGANLGGGE